MFPKKLLKLLAGVSLDCFFNIDRADIAAVFADIAARDQPSV